MVASRELSAHRLSNQKKDLWIALFEQETSFNAARGELNHLRELLKLWNTKPKRGIPVSIDASDKGFEQWWQNEKLAIRALITNA